MPILLRYNVRDRDSNIRGSRKMIDKANKAVGSITALGIALLGLAIIAELLVGGSNMAFLGHVTDNIIALVAKLGSAGLAGLISLGVVLWLFNR